MRSPVTWTSWRQNGWVVALVAGLVVSVAGALTLGPTANGLLQQILGWASVSIGITIARRSEGMVRRTWWCFALASSAFLIGGLARTVHGLLIDVERPFPSPAEAALVVGHILLITGSILLGHLRSPDRDRAAIIDGALIAAGIETVVWVALLWPYVNDATIPAAARGMNVFYAILTTALLASIARLAVGPGARTTSYRLLAVAVGLIFAQDLAVTVEAAGGPEARLGRALAPFIFVFFGAAALHPHLSRITEAADTLHVKLTWQRVALLVGALLINPAMLAVQEVLGNEPAVAVHIVSSVIISGLVLARLTYLLRSHERATLIEQGLRRANALLAVAPGRSEMVRALVEAVTELAGRSNGVRAAVVVADGTHLLVKGSSGPGAGLVAGGRLPVSDVAWWTRLGDDPIEVEDRPIDAPHRASAPIRTSYVVPLGISQTERHVLIVTSTDPLPVVLRGAIESLAATASLALETAELSEALQRSRIERRFQALVENSSDLIVTVDADRTISFVSPACRRLLGRDEASLLGAPARDLPVADDVALLEDLLAQADGATFSLPVEIRLRHADGSPRWFEVAARDLSFEPEVDGFVLNCREVSDRKDAELRLFRSEARFRALVQNVGDVVAVIDDWGRFTYVSPAVTPLLGYRSEQLLDTPATAIVVADQRREAQEMLLGALRGAADRSTPQSIELRALALDGSVRTLDVTVSDLRHDPAVHGIVLNARDVTVRKQLESTLRHQAHHDALTGLANRTRFGELVEVTSAEGNGSACVLFVDLDDFKTVNDSLGHAVGDELLIAVAGRLTASLPTGATAARLGGDEFAVLVRPTDDDLGPVGVALRLLHELRVPFDVNGWEIVVTASIGIAAIGDEGTTAEVVLRNADMAMYLAKERGKDRVELFEEAMHVTAFERLELKADLARAITSGQLALVYQPVVSLETGRITGAEALVRWDHPRRGRLSPDAFIGIAEETGLIVQLGQWVLEEACQQLRTWQLTLPSDAALSMSVNLSVRQLEQASIVDAVRDVVDQFALDPKTLTLEITETVVIEHMEDDRSRLTALKNLGVQLALDDFGTGYSSLRYADDLPVDVLKVDRSFVSGITDDEATPVLEAIVALGRRLGVHTVAEGIENPNQITALKSVGCDLGQGYWFSPPVAPEAFADLLTRNLSSGGFDTSGQTDEANRDS
ncbi:EAL domain-containing protein [Iamia sp. SCSIO 61187]|uniref:putative bifunctional diguanylate cyclase/phosphodiesterase n=1 Tax=Iamia sp. SCSIO 61187 TaxID=2722752 RepID=UPI001C6252E6|nr:bifunctional diguanylate cyclase/phosphodiesterase [Iamia sp. SCSIO 61187]QYG90990.1 EAL domain-containing protein [Iamia sp. SCSIO 61187]